MIACKIFSQILCYNRQILLAVCNQYSSLHRNNNSPFLEIILIAQFTLYFYHRISYFISYINTGKIHMYINAYFTRYFLLFRLKYIYQTTLLSLSLPQLFPDIHLQPCMFLFRPAEYCIHSCL